MVERAVMGTAAAERSAERPGDGASPGACAVDQITPERPEERQSVARARAKLPSRPGALQNERSERLRLTPVPLFLRLPGQPARHGQEERGRPGRAKRVVPR